MPAEGVPLSARGALLTRAELLRVARVFVRAGGRKVRLTGGEPTLRADLADIIRECSAPPVPRPRRGLTLGLCVQRGCAPRRACARCR